MVTRSSARRCGQLWGSRVRLAGGLLVLAAVTVGALTAWERFRRAGAPVELIAGNPPTPGRGDASVPAPGGPAGLQGTLERWQGALDESLGSALSRLQEARKLLETTRAARGLVPATLAETFVLRRRLSDLLARPLERAGALEVEWIEALLSLRAEKYDRAAGLLRGLTSEGSLPLPLRRADVEALAAVGERAAGLAEIARCSAVSAAALVEESLRREQLPATTMLALRARRWAARVVSSLAAGEALPDELARELRSLLAEASRQEPGKLSLQPGARGLGVWAEAALAQAVAAAQVEPALSVLAVLPAAPEHDSSLSLYERRRLRSQLLEIQGRESLQERREDGREDLLAAAQLRLDLGHELPRAEADLMVFQAAELLALAGAPRAALEALSTREGLGDDALLLQGRLHLELGDHTGALAVVEGLLVGREAPAAAIGPIAEEARALRGVARLRLGSARELAGDPRGGARDLLRGAAEDFRYLIGHLQDSSPACRAALYHRALQLEAEARRDGAERDRLEAAVTLLERWLATASGGADVTHVLVLDRLAALELRLGRPASARARLETLSGLTPGALRQDPSRLAFLTEHQAVLARAILEEAPYRLADVVLELGSREEALTAYEAALWTWPGSLLAPWARLRRAEILGALGETTRAAREAGMGLAALEPRDAATVRTAVPRHLADQWRAALRLRLEARGP